MIPSMLTKEWMQFIKREYMDSFVKEGGSALKFAIPLVEQARNVLVDGIDQYAKDGDYLVARVNADETKVHMFDQFFFKLADQVPWRTLCQRVINKLAFQKGYVGTVGTSDFDAPLYIRIANENRIDSNMVLMDLRRSISEQVFRYPKYARDFRVAMMHLCLAELSGGDDGANTFRVLTEWLTGRNKGVAAVKPYQIFNRISRANARYLLESMLRWVRFACYSGTVIILDIARLTLNTNPHDEKLFYTKAALLDLYEVLRQFIDGTDRMDGCFIVVVPDRAFLDEDPHDRGIGAYPALRYRVIDEIRDRHLVNPLVSLVRLE